MLNRYKISIYITLLFYNQLTNTSTKPKVGYLLVLANIIKKTDIVLLQTDKLLIIKNAN